MITSVLLRLLLVSELHFWSLWVADSLVTWLASNTSSYSRNVHPVLLETVFIDALLETISVRIDEIITKQSQIKSICNGAG